MKKRLLIIGGNGFIGFNAGLFFENKYEVFVIDKSALPEFLDNPANSYIVNIQDKKPFLNTVEAIDPHYVINLAGQSTVGQCIESPESAYLDNVLGNLNVLSVCLQLQQSTSSCFEKLLVHTSDKAYGDCPESKLPYKEDLPFYPGDIYSSSKSAQDLMTLAWSHSLGLNACVIRSGNIYGPGDLNFSRLIPKNIMLLLQQQEPVMYQNSSLMMRDFLYIDDLLSAYEVILKQGNLGEAYNVGTSISTKVRDIVKILKQVTACQHIKSKIIQSPLKEFINQELDCTKISDLGWKAKMPIDEGLFATIDFYKNYFNHLLKLNIP